MEHMKILWCLVTIATVIAGFALIGAIVASAAPAQGAAAAVAVGLAVIPYCFARSLQLMGETGRATCSYCRKHVSPDAVKCPYCHTQFKTENLLKPTAEV
jgi:hypothetical protein